MHSTLTADKPYDNKTQNKVFVVALDGADFHLINEFRQDLPNLNRLISGGVYGNLKSTIPCASTVAWSSFMTGKNPAKHGVFDFISRNKDNPTDPGKPVNASVMEGPTLWKILSNNGKRVGVFSVLMTYPPEEVNGFLIAGFPVPDDAEDYTYPRNLVKDLKTRGWNFADVPTQSYSKKFLLTFLSELYQRVKEKTDATLYLMKKYDWDFFIVHYFETDKVQHEFLNYKYARLVKKDLFERYGRVVKDFFIEIDNQLGRLLSNLDENIDIIIVSDHGFSPNENLIHVDTWLMNNGYTKLRDDVTTKFKYFMFKTGITPRNLYKLLPSPLKSTFLKEEGLKYYSKSSGFLHNLIMKTISLSERVFLNKKTDVDWNCTKAYSYGNAGFANIFFNSNVQGGTTADFETEREKLKNELECIIDPTSEEPVFNRVHLKEEIYSGKYLHEAPDIVAFDIRFRSLMYNHPSLFLSKRVISKNYMAPNRATHNMDGILITYGPDIKEGTENIRARIVDIAPTILHLMGLSIPRDMDGRVLKEIFKKESAPGKREVRYVKGIKEEARISKLTKEDEKKIMERLRAMGYLG